MAHAEDLHALAQHFKSRYKPIIIGHSWGAVLAMCYAAKHPSECHKIILLNSGLLNDLSITVFEENLTERMSLIEQKKSSALLKVRDKTEDAQKKSAFDLEYITHIFKYYNEDMAGIKKLKFSKRHVAHAEASHADYDHKLKSGALLQALKKIKDPVVGIHGAKDPVPIAGTVALMEKHIKNFTSHIILNAGHFPWVEKKAVPDFLTVLRRELA